MVQIIWNSATRGELLKFIDQRRSSPLPDGSFDLTPAIEFRYKPLSEELHVGEVYLRVYNEQPDFEISQAELFCQSLLEFISGIVDRRRVLLGEESIDGSGMLGEEEQPTYEEPSAAPPPAPIETEEEDDETEGLEGAVPEKEQPSESETLVKNLTMALTALQVCHIDLCIHILVLRCLGHS